MCKCNGKCGCKKYYLLAGRVLMAALFLIIGWGKITNFSGTVAFVAAGGFPMPTVFAVLAIIFEVGGALMVLTGYHARMGAKALIIFTAIATGAYHNAFSDPTQQLMMLKNLSIIGGLLYIAAFGAGACSLHKKCGDCGNSTCVECNNDGKKEGAIQGDTV